jgi:Glycosyl transferase family 11
MIIMTCRYGLANRLFYFAHCLALGEATGHHVFSSNIPESGPSFGGSHGAFCVWPKSSFPRIPWPNWSRRAFNVVFRKALEFAQKYPVPGVKIVRAKVDETDQVSVRNEEFLQMLRAHKLVIMTGWPAIDELYLPHPETVRSFFTPNPEITAECREIARKAKGDADILIGIHFRWGDYSHYGNGCFYYSIDVYLRVMKHCAALFPGQRVAFLCMSNEPDILKHTMELFTPLQVTLGPNTLIGDIVGLSECDYIISPASSFSLWAAFLGRKPVWCMADEHALPELKDFVIHEQAFEGMHPEGAHRVAAAKAATAGGALPQ